MTIDYVQAAISKVAADAPYTGLTHLDISAVTGDWTLWLRIIQLTGTARLEFEDSVDNFVAQEVGPAFSFQGPIESGAPVTVSVNKRDFPDLRAGVGSAEVRLSLRRLSAAGTITYQAWMTH